MKLKRQLTVGLSTIAISMFASADTLSEKEQDSVTISNLKVEDVFVSGFTTHISFDVTALNDVEGAVVSFGLKDVYSENTPAENIEYLESYTPDIYLYNTELDQLKTGETLSISESVTIEKELLEGLYLVVASVEKKPLLDASQTGGEILTEDEGSMPTLLGSLIPEQYYQVNRPEHPNLLINFAKLTGTTGYTLSMSDLPEVIRVDVEVLSEGLDLDQTTDVEFHIETPYGEIRTNIVEYEDGEEIQEPSWVLENACACPVLAANSLVGRSVNLEYDQNHLTRLYAQIPRHMRNNTLFYLVASIDKNNRVEEQDDMKSDNKVEMPIYIFE